MSSKKRLIGRAGASAVGVTLGLLPATAAFALSGADALLAVGPAMPATCATEPMTVSLGSQPDVLKGAPYSAVGTTEVVTTLADGNRITRTNTMKYYRDSAGRTRTEYQLAAIGPFVPEEAQSIVTITDPVSKQHYVLHPGLKRVDVFKMGAESGPTRRTGNAIFVGAANASVNGGPLSVGAQAIGSGAGVPAMRGRTAAGGGSRTLEMGTTSAFTGTDAPSGPTSGERRLVVHTAVDAPPPGSMGAVDLLIVNNGTPMQVCKGGSMKGAEPTSIGEKRIEGLKVTGSRLEFTLDAGTVGNEQPITVRTDQWFSADLGVVVSSMNHDPMIGDTTYRLEQINRAEPDASLFQIPADYSKNQMPF